MKEELGKVTYIHIDGGVAVVEGQISGSKLLVSNEHYHISESAFPSLDKGLSN